VAKNVRKPGLIAVLKGHDGASTGAWLLVGPSPAKHFRNVFAGIGGDNWKSPGCGPTGAPRSVSGGAVPSPAKHCCNVFAGIRVEKCDHLGADPKVLRHRMVTRHLMQRCHLMQCDPHLPNTFVMCLQECGGQLGLGDHLGQKPHPVGILCPSAYCF